MTRSGTATDGDGSGNGTGGGAGSDGNGSSSGGILLDVGDGMDSAGGGDCQSGTDGELEFSYVWVANSAEATVSKVDTVTMVEEGRYRTAPETGFASPSRTSVSLSGDVGVANRLGGVVKIYGNTEKCQESSSASLIESARPSRGRVRPGCAARRSMTAGGHCG